MRISLIITLFIVFSRITAQSSVNWATTIEVDVDTRSEDDRYTLARQSNFENFGDLYDTRTENFIGVQLYRAIRSGRLTAYKDAELTQAYGINELAARVLIRDTVVVINPETYESQVQITENEIDPLELSVIRLKIQLTYLGNGALEQRILSAKLISKTAGSAYHMKRIPIYFAVEQSAKLPKLRRLKKGLIEMFRLNGNLEASSSEQQTMMFKEMAVTAKASNDNAFTAGADSFIPLTDADKANLTYRTDTIAVIDPETYETMDKEVKYEIAFDRIENIRLPQYWVWDDRKAELTIIPIGYAPLVPLFDKGEKLIYEYISFYWLDKAHRPK